MGNLNNSTLKKLNVEWQHEQDAINGSSIQKRTYKLYDTLLCDYSTDDIRFMIGQKVGLDYLMPKAIEILKSDLFIEAGYYDGDLLKTVLIADDLYWSKFPSQRSQVLGLLVNNDIPIDSLFISRDTKKDLIEAVENFKRNYG